MFLAHSRSSYSHLLYLAHRLGLPVAAETVQHCKANSTLNMSLLRPSHAKEKKERERKRGGGKAPQETNPSSVRCLDANPQRKNVMSVCLHCVSPLPFSVSGLFLFPLILPHCFLQPCVLFSSLLFELSCLFASASFFPIWRLFISAIHLPTLDIPSTPR